MREKFNSPLLTLVIGFALSLALLAGPILNEHPEPWVKVVLIGVVGFALAAVFLFNATRRQSVRSKGSIPR